MGSMFTLRWFWREWPISRSAAWIICTLAPLISSLKTLLSTVNHDRGAAYALGEKPQGDDMTINAIEARIEWAARVARQSEEMIIIAAATKDDGMRSELLDFAGRLTEQVARIRALPAC